METKDTGKQQFIFENDSMHVQGIIHFVFARSLFVFNSAAPSISLSFPVCVCVSDQNHNTGKWSLL